MTRLATFAALTFSLVAAASDAEKDSCTIERGPNDVVRRKGDVTIEAGRIVENVISLEGTVTIKRGAKVKSVIAVRGDAVVEAGARVTESVITLAGQIRSSGRIDGSKIEVKDGNIKLTGENGDGLSGDLTLNNSALSRLILDKALEKIDKCVLKTAQASASKSDESH
jgi:NDP-sugar pyrophosphorylase family protein